MRAGLIDEEAKQSLWFHMVANCGMKRGNAHDFQRRLELHYGCGLAGNGWNGQNMRRKASSCRGANTCFEISREQSHLHVYGFNNLLEIDDDLLNVGQPADCSLPAARNRLCRRGE